MERNKEEKSGFDCVHMKREIQRRINEERVERGLKILSPQDVPLDPEMKHFMAKVKKFRIRGDRAA